MDKVLVTTPRIGSSRKNGEVKRSRRLEREGNYDHLPSHSSMRPKSRNWYDRKELNEYLNPLVRYLAKNCNRPWDKVYSEICKNMDRRGVVQDHIFQHLFDYVELKPSFKEGHPYRVVRGTPLYKDGYTFYVDKEGLLKEPKKKRPHWDNRYKEKSNSNLIKTKDESTFYVRRADDGTWFKATLEAWSDDLSESLFVSEEKRAWVVDAIGERLVKGKCVKIKTLSKKEKKELEITV